MSLDPEVKLNEKKKEEKDWFNELFSELVRITCNVAMFLFAFIICLRMTLVVKYDTSDVSIKQAVTVTATEKIQNPFRLESASLDTRYTEEFQHGFNWVFERIKNEEIKINDRCIRYNSTEDVNGAELWYYLQHVTKFDIYEGRKHTVDVHYDLDYIRMAFLKTRIEFRYCFLYSDNLSPDEKWAITQNKRQKEV